MTEYNYNSGDIKNYYLKNSYKKYTDHIIIFEKHIAKLFDNWVIDINNRNHILQQLDSLIQLMIKIYNNNLIKIYKELNLNEMFLQENLAYNSSYRNISDSLNIIQHLEGNVDYKNDPFHEIRSELISLCQENGYHSMDSFFRLYINDQYINLFDNSIIEIFELYNKVFIPYNITITEKIKSKNISNKIVISKVDSKCDSLIDNTCSVAILISNLSIKVVFEGYVVSDSLNAFVRTSQIYSRYLYRTKTETKNLLKKMYPHVDSHFYSKYHKFVNGCVYFVNSPKELVEKIASEYDNFNEISSKSLGSVMKEFTRGDIKTTFNIINLLLMGDEQNVSTAVLLFNLLMDRKISGESLSDIIYSNLSYHSQIKLKKGSSIMKNELNRLKSLTVENISIEKRLASLVNMPDNVKSYILEKINEIKTGENNYKLQMAVNGLMQFPWKPKDFKNEFADIRKSIVRSRDYLQNVAKKLDEAVYGHENSKKVLIELVGKWIQNPESSGQVIGFVGPPGIGKTLLAKSISSALGIPLSIVGLGGMNDSSDLIGHSFTYAGAQYGMIVRQMIKAGNWRCVMFFDEVDKVSKRNDTNEIYNTLIHITDPNMNQHFQDRFYSSSIEFDLSGVLVIFSYNNSDKLDPILLDRIKEIHMSAYATQDKILIAQNYILKELCSNIGFQRERIHFDDAMVRYIIEKYTTEAGVRELRRKLEQILLKLNIDRFYMRGPFRQLIKKKCLEVCKSKNIELVESDELSEDRKSDLSSYVEYKKSRMEDILDVEILNKIFNLDFEDKIIITQELIHKYLDKPIILNEETHKDDMIGVINGLYTTTLGIGGIVPIQISKNYTGNSNDKKNKRLKINNVTGNLKHVMRESVTCAHTTAINILNSKIKNKIMENFPYGFHIHASDAATPKDGPSAGCAFTTAFVSVLVNKKINKNIAMTGEIDLTGKIKKIGGLDAKLSGAKKSGIKCVYICEENREDYETIKKKNPDLFDKNFEIKIADHILDIVTDPNVIVDINETDFDVEILAEYKRRKGLKTIKI